MLRFDSFPVVFWLLSSLLCLGLGWVALRSRLRDRWVLGLALGVLFVLRLPTLVYNREINPDESQMITQGRTLAVDPVYSRSVDGTTIGPLDSYALILPAWVGLPYDYLSARLLAYGLIALSLLLFFLTARRWYGSTPARLALLPFVFALGLTQSGDLLSYSSELVPLGLLALATWLFARIDGDKRPAVPALFGLGLLLGMVPLGKIQGAPLALVLGLFVVISLWTKADVLARKLVRTAALGVGALVFPAAFVGMAWLNGLYDDFWLFYIEGNLRYGGNTDHWQNVLNFPRHLANGEEIGWLLVMGTGLALLALLRTLMASSRLRWSGPGAFRVAFIGLSLLAAFYSVTRTGTEFVHYFFLLVGPVFLLMALSWKRLSGPGGTYQYPIPALITGLFLALIIGKGALNYSRQVPLNRYPNVGQSILQAPQPPLVEQIRRYAREGEPLVVWGWRCDYYVSAGMIQGTAENHSERCVFVSPMTPVYQRRYLNDFMRTVPPVFVDAVGSQNHWITDRKTQGHEIIKPLGAFVQAHYQYMGLYNDARLYVRKDRLAYVD